MKLLKLSFVLVFIAVALFLNGASEGAETLTPKETPQSVRPPENQKPQASKQTQEGQQEEKSTSKEPAMKEQPGAKDVGQQRKYEQEQMKIQQKISDFTFALVVIGGLVGAAQVFLMALTYFVNNKAANAAKLAAEVARDTLIDKYRARLSIEGVYFGQKGGHLEQDPDVYEPVISYQLKNSGPLAACGVVTTVIRRHGIGRGFRWPDRRETFPNASQEEFGLVIDSDKVEWITRYFLKSHNGEKPLLTRQQWDQMIDGLIQMQIGIIAAYLDGRGNERISEKWYLFDSTKRTWKLVLAQAT